MLTFLTSKHISLKKSRSSLHNHQSPPNNTIIIGKFICFTYRFGLHSFIKRKVCGDAIDYNYAIVEPDTDKEKARQLAKGAQAIIVVKNDKILGILTKTDFI